MKRVNLLKTSNNLTNTKDSITEAHFGSLFNLFIYKKTLRINEAIYLVTSHISDKEFIKFNTREVAVKLSSMSIKINNSRDDKELDVLYGNFFENIVELITMLEVLFVSGFIKESNFNLINRELNKTYSDIKEISQGSFVNEKNLISANFFDFDTDQIKRTNKQQTFSIKDKDIKDSDRASTESIVINKVFGNKEEFAALKEDTINVSDMIEKTDRKNKILSFFENNKKLTVRDVALLLPQYGDKTIQRELVKLVKNGELLKEGEKRWTVYFLPKK